MYFTGAVCRSVWLIFSAAIILILCLFFRFLFPFFLFPHWPSCCFWSFLCCFTNFWDNRLYNRIVYACTRWFRRVCMHINTVCLSKFATKVYLFGSIICLLTTRLGNRILWSVCLYVCALKPLWVLFFLLYRLHFAYSSTKHIGRIKNLFLKKNNYPQFAFLNSYVDDIDFFVSYRMPKINIWMHWIRWRKKE